MGNTAIPLIQLANDRDPPVEPAGCQIPDDIRFHVYTRERADLPADATPLDRQEHLLYSNDHPLFEFKAHEDPQTRWTRIYVGVENPATGRKEMVQTKKLIVRAVSKDKKPASTPDGENGESETVCPHPSNHGAHCLLALGKK